MPSRSLDELDEDEGLSDPSLVVQPWWLSHLKESGRREPDNNVLSPWPPGADRLPRAHACVS